MAIHKITYSEGYKRANIHNYGCNFDCSWCSYKLRNDKRPERFLSMSRIKKMLGDLGPERVHFIGGEPTLYTGLGELASFAHDQLGAFTKIGHSNGSRLPPPDIDAWSVSIRTMSEKDHIAHSGGYSALKILQNFKDGYDVGIEMDASSILIPGFVEKLEIERIARFIADIDRNIPYHLVGYLPVPNAPWHGPTCEEVHDAVNIAREHLSNVTSSCLSIDDLSDLKATDIRYHSVQVV